MTAVHGFYLRTETLINHGMYCMPGATIHVHISRLTSHTHWLSSTQCLPHSVFRPMPTTALGSFSMSRCSCGREGQGEEHLTAHCCPQRPCLCCEDPHLLWCWHDEVTIGLSSVHNYCTCDIYVDEPEQAPHPVPCSGSSHKHHTFTTYLLCTYKYIPACCIMVCYAPCFSLRRGAGGMLPIHMACLSGYSDCVENLILPGKASVPLMRTLYYCVYNNMDIHVHTCTTLL